MSSHTRANAVLATIVVLLLIIGLGLLIWASKSKTEDVWHHLKRDLGITCLMSVIVTMTYEVYIRKRVDLEKIQSVLSTVAGSNIPPRVWDSIRSDLLSRKLIRLRSEVRLWLRPLGAAGSQKYILQQE